MKDYHTHKLCRCQVCGHSSRGPYALELHMRVHTGVRPFQCINCGVAFTQKGNLKRHMLTHRPQSTFKCPSQSCSYITRSYELLKPHMMRHGIGLFQCHLCHLKPVCFLEEAELRKHIAKTHVNVTRDQLVNFVDLCRLRDDDLTIYRDPTVVTPQQQQQPPYSPPKPDLISDGEDSRGLEVKASDYYDDSSAAWNRDADLNPINNVADNVIDLDKYEEEDIENSNGVSDCGLTNAQRASALLSRSKIVTKRKAAALSSSRSSLTEDHMPASAGSYAASSTISQDPWTQFGTRSPASKTTSMPSAQRASEKPLIPVFVKSEAPIPIFVKSEESNCENTSPLTPPSSFYHCTTCDIYFGDLVIYAIHAGCHNRANPLECNTCGMVSRDRYEFTSHFARGDHCHRVSIPR